MQGVARRGRTRTGDTDVVKGVVAVLVLLTQSAVAEPLREERSEGFAVLLSLGVSIGGAATVAKTEPGAMWSVGAAALFLGPSIGHLYADQIATPGLALRALAIPVGLLGLWKASAVECTSVRLSDGDCPASEPTEGTGYFLGAATLFVLGSIWDVVTVPRAIRRWNRMLVVSPTVIGNDRALGLAFGGAF
jgi:hypothetical protein